MTDAGAAVQFLVAPLFLGSLRFRPFFFCLFLGACPADELRTLLRHVALMHDVSADGTVSEKRIVFRTFGDGGRAGFRGVFFGKYGQRDLEDLGDLVHGSKIGLCQIVLPFADCLKRDVEFGAEFRLRHVVLFSEP